MNMENYKYYYKTAKIMLSDSKIFEIDENMKELNISNKFVAEVNLPPKLEVLECSGNMLKELNVNHCTNIVRLDCSENKLTNLNTDNCTKLKYLYCNDNLLTSLKVEKCTSLIRLNCLDNQLKEIELWVDPKVCNVRSNKNVNIIYKKTPTPNFNQTEQQVSNLILKIKNPTLWSIADQLTRNIQVEDKETKFNIKEVKKLANSIPALGQMLTKKEGSMLLKKHSNGFTILDIEALSFELENKDSLLQNKFIEIGHSVWGDSQIYFKKETNHVIQINLKSFKNNEVLDLHPNKENLEAYIKRSNHPTSSDTLTLAWVRYTYLEDKNAIVLDEIQTDLNDDKFLGEELIKGWEEFTMKLFIQYVRKQYKIRKIYMPTYATKLDLYSSNPPMYLYKELPNKFGFKKNSDMDGFMVLENNLFESFKDYLQNKI